MKYTIGMLSLLLFFSRLYAQKNDTLDINAECNKIARQAFEKLNHATKKWFNDVAAKHPPGNLDTTWTKAQLKTKFTATQLSQMGDLFALMISYQKMMNKESKEDKKIARDDKKLELAQKEAKLKQENVKIDQQKTEASQRYDQAMQAAEYELILGSISSTIQVSANTAQVAGSSSNKIIKADSLKSKQADQTINTQTSDKSKLKVENENTKKTKDPRQQKLEASLKKLRDQLGLLNKSRLVNN